MLFQIQVFELTSSKDKEPEKKHTFQPIREEWNPARFCCFLFLWLSRSFMSVENTCWWKLMPSGVPRGVSFDQVIYVRVAYFLRIFTIKLYSKKFHNILECIQDSDCTGNSDTCVKGQCRCGTKPRVCRHSLNPAVKIMCIEGECVKIPGNKNNTKLFDKYLKQRNKTKFIL